MNKGLILLGVGIVAWLLLQQTRQATALPPYVADPIEPLPPDYGHDVIYTPLPVRSVLPGDPERSYAGGSPGFYDPNPLLKKMI